MTEWQQQIDKPLFPDVLWSRPETRHGAGKLLIIGGQAHEFLLVAESYTAAEKAGAGTIRVIMPESTRKVTKMLPNIEYASANQSGSFARDSLAELLDASQWADGILLAGNLGKNSETSLMLENFIKNYTGLLFINADPLVSLSMPTNELFERQQTVLSMRFNDLQKAAITLGIEKPVTSKLISKDFAQILHELTASYPVALIIYTDNFVWNAKNGNVVATKMKQKESLTTITTKAAVWAIQQPNKMHEAIANAIYC